TYGEYAAPGARSLFKEVYLPEVSRTLQYHWYDSGLFDSEEQQLEVIEASASRGCEYLQLSYPWSFIFSCGIRSADWMIFEHLCPTFSLDINDCVWYLAGQFIHFTEEKDPRVQTSIARGLMNPYISPDTPFMMPERSGILNQWLTNTCSSGQI